MRRPRPGFRTAIGLSLVLIASATASGQAPPPDATSLARYVPAEDLVFLLEFDGVDAHAESWRKTAAYKVLNNTPAGAMIEDVLGQWLGGPGLVKHMLRSGFVLGVGRKPGASQPFYVVQVARAAFSNREVRPIVAQYLASLNPPNAKAQAIVRVGHKIYSGKTKDGATYSWWVEETKKEDLVLVFPTPEAADLILETLDGKRENAINHPLRADLLQASNGFDPVGIAFLDPKVANASADQRMGFAEVTRLDVRWGFQGDALQTIVRVATPSPRKGVLAAFDGPTFDRNSLPPLPSTVTGFAVASLDTRAAFDLVLALAVSASPAAADRIKVALDSIQGKSKLRLREDILGHLGPRMAFYTLPPRVSEVAPAAPPGIGALLMAMGMAQVPRGVAVIEVDDPVAFGKSLDELMLAVNRELKVLLAPPRDPAVEDVASPRGRGPTPEFRMSSGTPKTYNFSVPPELSKAYPPSLRPSIRVGDKHVVIAVTPDAAREALESRGAWSPPSELAGAFQTLPAKLKYLQVGDHRAAIAATLASFPAKIQALANSPAFSSRLGPSKTPAASPTPAPEGSARGESSEGPAAGPEGAKAPVGPAPVVIQVAPGALPSADVIRGLLFPSIGMMEVDPGEIRLISRVAFPDVSWLAFAPIASLSAKLADPKAAAPARPESPGAGLIRNRAEGATAK